MKKRSSFKNWFYSTWQLMRLTPYNDVQFQWSEFQLHLEEAYNAGVRKGLRLQNKSNSA